MIKIIVISKKEYVSLACNSIILEIIITFMAIYLFIMEIISNFAEIKFRLYDGSNI